MTSSDKPDNVDASAETTREERAVVTAAPGADAEPASGAEVTSSGGDSGKPKNGGKPAGGDKPRPAQPEASAPTVVTALPSKGTLPKVTPKPAAPASAPAASAAASPAAPVSPTAVSSAGVPSAGAPAASSAEGAEVTSSAPPPWQRVATDNQYAKEHTETPAPATPAAPVPTTGFVGTGSPSEETTRFSDWGYQRSPRSDGYSKSSADAADALASHYPPAVAGTAAPSMFAAAAGKSGVQPEARPGNDPSGRTTVNMAAPPPPAAPAPAAQRPAGTTGLNAPTALRRPGRGPRRASLQVKRVDPWSVLKLAFVLSVALFFVWLVAVGVLYGVLDGMGVWDRVNGTYNEFAQNTASGSSGPLITASRVFGIAAIIGAINIVLFTALATVGSFVYNVSADLAGGLEITLAERE